MVYRAGFCNNCGAEGGGEGGGIPEAPNDGQQYGRESEAWTPIEAGGEGDGFSAKAVNARDGTDGVYEVVEADQNTLFYLTDVDPGEIQITADFDALMPDGARFDVILIGTPHPVVGGPGVGVLGPDGQPAVGNFLGDIITLTKFAAGTWIASGAVAHDAPDSGIPEAPNDGQQYGRENEAWTPIEAGGGGDYTGPEVRLIARTTDATYDGLSNDFINDDVLTFAFEADSMYQIEVLAVVNPTATSGLVACPNYP